MTPKQQAQLITTQYNLLNKYFKGFNKQKAKELSLILVEQKIIETGLNYWQQVKQEIEKL
jgi:ribosomal protein S15P/S13E